MRSWLDLYSKPSILVVLVLGFISGLPLALTSSTLSVWLVESGVSLSSIGLFAAVGTPYTIKFLWSPLIDGIKIPLLEKLLGRRRGWLVAVQTLLMASLISLAFCSPAENALTVALLALLVSVFSATQDIIIDAYRVEILPTEEQGAGAAMAVFGYRIGMIVSGAGALFLAADYGWTVTYVVMAMLIPVAWIAISVGKEPPLPQKNLITAKNGHLSLGEWLENYIVTPFSDFMKRDHWLIILLFILLYKMGDAFIGVMTNPFLIKIGFSKEEIATVVKLYGLIATIIGSFVGGVMVSRIGMMKTLWICGIFHALTNLMFVVQAKIGADLSFLAFSIAIENISGGMGTTGFVAFISSLVNKNFTATQYALLSSFSAFGRTLLSTPAGKFAEYLGWEWFFILSVFLAVPGLVLLYILSKKGDIYSKAT